MQLKKAFNDIPIRLWKSRVHRSGRVGRIGVRRKGRRNTASGRRHERRLESHVDRIEQNRLWALHALQTAARAPIDAGAKTICATYLSSQRPCTSLSSFINHTHVPATVPQHDQNCWPRRPPRPTQPTSIPRPSTQTARKTPKSPTSRTASRRALFATTT